LEYIVWEALPNNRHSRFLSKGGLPHRVWGDGEEEEEEGRRGGGHATHLVLHPAAVVEAVLVKLTEPFLAPQSSAPALWHCFVPPPPNNVSAKRDGRRRRRLWSPPLLLLLLLSRSPWCESKARVEEAMERCCGGVRPRLKEAHE